MGRDGEGGFTCCGPRGGREESIIFVDWSAELCGGRLFCWKLIGLNSDQWVKSI